MLDIKALKNSVESINDISGVDVSIFDSDGRVMANTAPIANETADVVSDFLSSDDDELEANGEFFFKVYLDQKLEAVISTKGDNARLVGQMAVLQIKAIIDSADEESEKETFIKNLLLDNLLIIDIASQAKSFDISTKGKRCVYIVEVEKDQENLVATTLKNIFTDRDKDFVTSLGENSVILIKDVEDDEESEVARIVLDMINTELMIKTRVAYGSTIEEIRDVSRSYKEAVMALDVGSAFARDEYVMAYDNLGIGRLIYQLPLPLCEMYIKEVFKGVSPTEFDEETLATVDKFFENNLNVSEAARQLYIHRNTLVYRLDKIQNKTGLDLRVLDDAITFKMGMMIVRYMEYIKNNN